MNISLLRRNSIGMTELFRYTTQRHHIITQKIFIKTKRQITNCYLSFLISRKLENKHYWRFRRAIKPTLIVNAIIATPANAAIE